VGHFLSDGRYQLDQTDHLGNPIIFNKTHKEHDDCQKHGCSLHTPSKHPLHNAPQGWHGAGEITTRQCPCKNWHPDPDSVAFLKSTLVRLQREHALLVMPPESELGSYQTQWERADLALSIAKTHMQYATRHTCCALFCCTLHPMKKRAGRQPNPLRI
jgi:hypothetical protein